jgi:hypothetical protein
MMEEAVFARYGLLGLVVLALTIFGPRILDRMTKFAVQHGESEDRRDERMTDAFLEGVRMEREGYQRERLQFLSTQDAFRLQIERFDRTLAASNETLGAFNISLTEIRAVLKEIKTVLKDFDARMVLYLKAQEKQS